MGILVGDETTGKEPECKLCTERKPPDPERDNCYQTDKGKECKTVWSAGVATKYCCDWTQEGKCKCEKEYTNPCTDPTKCAACMVYAEGEGTEQACKDALACVIRNRTEDNDNNDDMCQTVAEQHGDTTEFTPYKCVCDSGPNATALQKYCDCCGSDDPEQEFGQEYTDALQAVTNATGSTGGCPGSLGNITYFGSGGAVPTPCDPSDEVPVPGCTKMKFYNCPYP